MNPTAKESEFLKVVEQHNRLIYKISYGYCSNLEDRKDLAQEIILQLWKSFDQFNDKYKLSTWIYRIALNVSISYLRKVKTRSKGQLELVPDFEVSTDAEKPEEIDQLYKFINQLDQMNKALIILYLDELSYAEMAEVLGITETNVATKLNRIKQRLKEQFVGYK